jgi:hypothetical protein
LFCKCRIIGEAGLFKQQCIKLWLDAANRYILTIAAFEDIIKMRASVKQVCSWFVFIKDSLVQNGDLGVNFFFTLSGFLIT